MNPPLTISQAQLAAMAQPKEDHHRAYVLQELEKEWKRHTPDWTQLFVHSFTLAERKTFFSDFYTWALRVPLEEWADLLKVGTLLLRAKCQGWPPEDLALAKEYIETAAAPPQDDPTPAIQWLEWAFDQ